MGTFVLNGALAERYAYSPFGQVNAPSHPAIGNPYLFAGREFDSETGLYYSRARYYDPDMGRFLSTDPLGYADGMNLYAYVRNNPINSADALGLYTVAVGSTFLVGAGAGATGQTSLAVDSSGNVALVETSGGGGCGCATASAGVAFSGTNAKTVHDLQGTGGQAGGSVGSGTSVGAEYVVGNQADGSQYHGFDLNISASVGPMPAEAHGFVTSTEVTFLFSFAHDSRYTFSDWWGDLFQSADSSK